MPSEPVRVLTEAERRALLTLPATLVDFVDPLSCEECTNLAASGFVEAAFPLLGPIWINLTPAGRDALANRPVCTEIPHVE